MRVDGCSYIFSSDFEDLQEVHFFEVFSKELLAALVRTGLRGINEPLDTLIQVELFDDGRHNDSYSCRC